MAPYGGGPDDNDGDEPALGVVVRGSKGAAGGPQELASFSVKKGDNGGVLICETYERKAPEGRRAGAGFPMGGDYKENPFSPDDGAAAAAHITGLLQQMGVAPGTAPRPAVPPRPPLPPRPAMAPTGPPPAGPVGPPRPPLGAIATGPRGMIAARRPPQ